MSALPVELLQRIFQWRVHLCFQMCRDAWKEEWQNNIAGVNKEYSLRCIWYGNEDHGWYGNFLAMQQERVTDFFVQQYNRHPLEHSHVQDYTDRFAGLVSSRGKFEIVVQRYNWRPLEHSDMPAWTIMSSSNLTIYRPDLSKVKANYTRMQYYYTLRRPVT